MRLNSRHAFSLVELSIVLVILGLLVGGVLTGQSLIRASELRAVTSEYQRYIAAMHSFRDKYFALPGDMTNATTFWGNKTGAICPGTEAGPVDTANGTCNGTGDGIVHISPIPFSGFTAKEQAMFWHHLSKANLIEGTYSAHDISASPLSRLSQGVWMINYIQRSNANGCIQLPARYDIYGATAFQVLAFMSTTPLTAGCPGGLGILKAEEAYNIDTKIDDGYADKGKVLVTNDANTTSGCINNPASDTGGTITSGSFQLTDSSKTCRLFFKILQ